MNYATYSIIRLVLMGLVFYLGTTMIFTKIKAPIRNSLYHSSLRVMGVAFFIVPLSCLLYNEQTQLDLAPYVSTAISFSAYHTTFILMSLAFLMLLGMKIKQSYIIAAIISAMLFPVPIWASILNGGGRTIRTFTTISYVLFVATIIYTVWYILLKYKRVKQSIENYYADEAIICVQWISKSIKLLIGLSATCALAPLFYIYSLPLRFVFMIYGIICYCYIYYGYRKMLANLHTRNYNIPKLIAVERDIESPAAAPIKGNSVDLGVQLSKWIEQRKYLVAGFTINDVAQDIGTNRTYLSKYINTTHGYSFRKWITLLRAEEAKKLLCRKPEIPISDIAQRVGSASTESFTHIFTRNVGMSPTKWRENNS